MICQHGTVKDHKTHDYDLLADVAANHGTKLCDEAEQMAKLQATLEQGIARVKQEETALVEQAQAQKNAVKTHFEQLALVLLERKQQLIREIEAAQARKQNLLTGQREELEHAVASMESGGEHARRTAELGDDFEVMQAYSSIVNGMRGLREKEYQLQPVTRASIKFGGIKKKGGKLSFRSELANRMQRKQQSIVRKGSGDAGGAADAQGLEALGEADEGQGEDEEGADACASNQRASAPSFPSCPAPGQPPGQQRASAPALPSPPTKDPGQAPTWKRNIIARKAITAHAEEPADGEAEVEDDPRWKGEPAWKVNLLRERARKERESNAPLARQEEEERAKAEKLAAMPAWMRALAEK